MLYVLSQTLKEFTEIPGLLLLLFHDGRGLKALLEQSNHIAGAVEPVAVNLSAEAAVSGLLQLMGLVENQGPGLTEKA